MRTRVILAVLSLSSLAAAAAAPWHWVHVAAEGGPIGLAATDLQRYLAQVGGTVPELLDSKSAVPAEPGIVLAHDPAAVDALGTQGYRVEPDGGGVRITGATDVGVVNGVYAFLHMLGYRFYLGSEHLPPALPERLAESRTAGTPELRVRGVLPWYNFFNSPTTWDPADHRTFADQLVRSGANFVGFHTYDGEPFAGVIKDGEVRWGGRLLNTAAPTWGTHPLRSAEFAFGTDRLFAGDAFGAATTFLDVPDADAVRAEQEVMRDALDYASRRGLITCLGFELHGDPTDPVVRDAFLARVNLLMDRYPMLDVIWLWQPETQGAQGFPFKYNVHVLPDALRPGSPLALYGMARRAVFKRVVEEARGERPFFQDNEAGRLARAVEGARLEQFAQLALRAMRRRQNPPRLAMAGWGGDTRLLSAEYYEGLDRLLPEDVVFTSLDHIAPRERVDAAYHALPAPRERWPIPWLENDGDQWRPQPYVHVYEAMARDIARGGSQGVLGIHWRTREVEDNFAYLVDFAWNPDLTAADFFADKARHTFDPAIADEMASILTRLDELGYLWVGGSGQNECAPFSWGMPDTGKLAVFRALLHETRALLPRAAHGKQHLEWLLARMDWVSKYADAQIAANEAGALLARARQAPEAEQAELAIRGLVLLDRGALGEAMHAYARRLSTRGEYGVLATINTKAAVAWRNLRAELADLAGVDPAIPETPWSPEPCIVLPRLVGSAPAGEPLVLDPLVLGGAPAWAHYRELGGGGWRTVPLERVQGWVHRFVVPPERVTPPGLLAGFSFSEDPADDMAFGPVGVTVHNVSNFHREPLPAAAPPSFPERLNAALRPGAATLVELHWDDVPQAAWFRVYRDNILIVETAVPFFPDNPSWQPAVYRVEAVDGGEAVSASADVTLDPSAFSVPPPEPLDVLDAVDNGARILLHWQAAPSAHIARFTVERREPGGAWSAIGSVPAAATGDYRWADQPSAGNWEYRVTPIGPSELAAEGATAGLTFAPGRFGTEPALDLTLTEAPEGSTVTGGVVFAPGGAMFSGGRIEIPHAPFMDLGQGMSLHFEFKFDTLAEMPVLLCHGAYAVNGWFAQVLNGRLLVRTPGGDAEGPPVETGRWYAVDFVFDGLFFNLAVDGAWLPQARTPVPPVPAELPLVLGTYLHDEARYHFLGTMRNVRIYEGAVLAPPDIEPGESP